MWQNHMTKPRVGVEALSKGTVVGQQSYQGRQCEASYINYRVPAWVFLQR